MQAESGTARFFLSRLADKKQRAMGGARPEAQPAAFRQTKMQGIAAHLEDDGREGSAFDSSLCQPERIVQLARRGMEKPLRLQPEIPEPRRIGATSLQRADCIADPEQRQLSASILFLPLQPRRNGHRQTARRPGIAGTCRSKFGNRIEQKTPFQRLVEGFHAERQPRQNTLLPRFASFRHGFACRCSERWRGLSLQSGDGFAERKKPLTRQGGLRHGVLSIRLVPVMFL